MPSSERGAKIGLVCAALFLGLHNGHNPIRHNPGAARGWDRTTQGDPPLPNNVPTFANVMKQAGYATACFGKWGMGVPGGAGSPARLGFDTFLGYASHVDAHTYWTDHLWRNDRQVPLDGKTYTHDLFTAEALSYIRASRERPFFIFLSYTIPHVAFDPPSLEPYANEPWPEKEKAFAAMVTRLDRDVGRIGSLLQELGLDDDTLVVFASDNGPCTAGGHKATTFRSTPFRAEKGSPYGRSPGSAGRGSGLVPAARRRGGDIVRRAAALGCPRRRSGRPAVAGRCA